MASLNLSQNGASISASYQKIVNSPAPSGAAANSPTYGQWAVFAVQAPLANAFQPDPSKESVLKVQDIGEGELIDMIEDFSDGKIQFAFVKVKDTNSGLPKNVLVCWCGEGVPERTKGYFTSHMNAVSKLLHGYHVQITARTDQDLTPEGIVRKVADSSGSKYGGGSGDAPAPSPAGRPPVASKPSMPTKTFGATGSYSMGGRTRAPAPAAKVDADGWGEDAPQVTRSQLEKVGSAYQPTKVDIAALQSGPDASRSKGPGAAPSDPNVVKGGYQPIGKVDIASIRAQAQAQSSQDDRPTTVKGAYEPVGKVDIADIRRKAQGTGAPAQAASPPPAPAAEEDERPKSLADRSAAFTTSERMTSLPKPKVANRFGADTSSFSGTKAPTPGGFEAKPAPAAAAPIGAAGRTFADSAGKTPAQQWAEKKARERGNSGAAQTISPAATGAAASPIQSQQSGGWQSSYAGKKWGVQIPSRTGGSGISEQKTGQDEPEVPEQQQEDNEPPSGGIGSIRDRFKDAPPMGAARDPPSLPEPTAPQPPPLDTASKPNAGAARGVPVPGMLPPPPQPQPEEDDEEDAPPPPARPQFEGHPTQEHVNMPPPPPRPMPESDDEDDIPQGRGSPIPIARPVARGPSPAPLEKADTHSPPPPMPTEAISQAISQTQPVEPEPQLEEEDPARGASQAAAAASFGSAPDPHAGADNAGGHEAIAQYDYEKAEDNELELREGERVFNIDMVDDDWWMGENSRGEKGLFPSNYVELVEGGGAGGAAAPPPSAPIPAAAPAPVQDTPAPPPAAPVAAGGKTATAQYDYQAAEDNELSFPDGGKITDIVSHSSVYLCVMTRTNSVSRNSPTKTGGSATTAASPACSLPTMSSLTRKVFSQEAKQRERRHRHDISPNRT